MSKVGVAAMDTLVWQAFASVIVPGERYPFFLSSSLSVTLSLFVLTLCLVFYPFPVSFLSVPFCFYLSLFL